MTPRNVRKEMNGILKKNKISFYKIRNENLKSFKIKNNFTLSLRFNSRLWIDNREQQSNIMVKAEPKE